MDAAEPPKEDEMGNYHINPETGTPYSRAMLLAAFNRVAPENWKDKIDARVTLDTHEWTVLREAVIFYTGSVPTAMPVAMGEDGTVLYRVRAAGYYATIGA